MGKIITPTFRAEYRDQTGWHDMCWNARGGTNRTCHGKPTKANAEKLRQAMNASFQPGGFNGHCRAMGGIVHINRLRVVRQSTGETVAETVAPMFEVI